MRRIVEIARDHRHLRAERGFLVVEDTADSVHEVGRVPFDDVEALIAHGHGITVTTTVLARLVEQSAPFVVVDGTHNATGMLLACDGNVMQALRFDAQVAASKPMLKRMWADIVRAKILQQASVLELVGKPNPTRRLRVLADDVHSGDTTNAEAMAARLYWPALFGPTFRRDRGGLQPNGFLNYGYTVLRATTARAVVAAGLHPTLGIHHRNDANPMRLVDDLVEPFRPFVDLQAWILWRQGRVQMGREEKTSLVEVMARDLDTVRGRSPVAECIQVLATSLAHVLLDQAESLTIPDPQVPTDMGDLVTER